MARNALIDPTTKMLYPDLYVGGGGGGQVNSLSGGPGINIAGTAAIPQVNLDFTAAPGEIMVGTGALAGAPLAPVLNGILSCVGGTPSYIAPGALGEVLSIGVGGIPVYANVGQSPFTIQGQIQYADAALADANLNIGTANQILGVVAGLPAWKDAGASGLITATLPLVENAGVGNASNIAVNFAAGPAGQIPYGNGTALTGALTNTPTANQILGVVAGVPAWKDAGASGLITATLPLIESAGVGNASNIAINYTNLLKGEIPVGSGATNTGILLAAPTSAGVAVDGYSLQSFASAPGGLRWVPPSTNSNTIYRSSTATTAVLPPTSTQDTCILVAEDPNGSWDLLPNLLDQSTTPYEVELISNYYPFTYAGPVGPVIADLYVLCEVVYVNSARCIQLSIVDNAGGAVAPKTVGIFMSDVGVPATMFDCVLPISAGGPGPPIALLTNSFLVSGCFSKFHFTDPAVADLEVYNVAVINISAYPATITITPLQDYSAPPQQLAPDFRGFQLSNANNDSGYVSKILYYNNNQELGFFGRFNGYINGVGQATTFNSGWFSMGFYNCVLGSYEGIASTVDVGFGVAITLAPAFDVGSVNDAFWLPAGDLLCIVGSWNFLSQDGPGGATGFLPAAAGMTGFARGDFSGLAPTIWGASPTVLGGFQSGICLRISASLPDTLIAAGGNAPLFYNTTANTLAYATGPIPTAPSMRQSWNCIGGGQIDIGFGIANYDFVLYQDIVALEMYVIWFSAATAQVAQPLIPTPTGVAPEYYQITYPVQYGGPYTGLSSYGITADSSSVAPSPILASLVMQGKDGLYRFDPVVHATLAFTGVFFAEGVAAPGYTAATFATGGVPQGPPQSQSYIATKDLKGWIQIGAKTDGITYT
jgi:hypothetical protein|nr:MAG: hypothetical protein [Lake Baikal virophage 2]